MQIRIQEMLRSSEASSQLAKLANDVVAGAGKVLTKNREPFVALIGTRKLAYYRALEAEHPSGSCRPILRRVLKTCFQATGVPRLNSKNQSGFLTFKTGFVSITKAYGGFFESRTQATVPPGDVTRGWRERDATSDSTKMGLPAWPATMSFRHRWLE